MRNDDGTTAEEGFSLWMDWRDQIMSTSTGADSIDFIFNGRNLCCVCIHSTGEGEVSFQRTFWRTSDRFYFKCSKICRASSFRWKVLLMSKEPSRHHPKMAMTKPMKPQPKTCSKDPQKDLKKKMTFQQLQISEGNITFQNCRINVKAWPQESLKADEAQSTGSWKRRGGWSVQFPKWSWWILLLLLQSKSWPAFFQKDIITRREWIIDPKQWQSDSSRISSSCTTLRKQEKLRNCHAILLAGLGTATWGKMH